MSGHSYEKWKDLGFQVTRGEKATYEHFGVPMFTRSQVVKIDSSKTHSGYGFCRRCGKKLRGDRSKDLCYECWKNS